MMYTWMPLQCMAKAHLRSLMMCVKADVGSRIFLGYSLQTVENVSLGNTAAKLESLYCAAEISVAHFERIMRW